MLKHKQIFVFLICVFGFLFFIFGFCQAAILYLEPSQGEHRLEDTFLVEIRLNTEQEYINVVEGNLTFPQDVLEVKDFSQGNSILTLWVKQPTFSNQEGNISFAGGVPGGYKGADGLLGKLVFKAKNQGQAEIKILKNSSQALLNDGFGTKAKLATHGVEFRILPEKAEVPKDQWQEELRKDKIPPESFKIEISQDPSIFEGKYFIAFSTTDKQTGIDYYEVKEGDRAWKLGQTPHLLEDQALSGIIKVKAVDKAGNERIAEYIPEIPEIPKEPFPYLAIILILLGLSIIWWILRKIKTKNY